jgi:hypothetical protein
VAWYLRPCEDHYIFIWTKIPLLSSSSLHQYNDSAQIHVIDLRRLGVALDSLEGFEAQIHHLIDWHLLE